MLSVQSQATARGVVLCHLLAGVAVGTGRAPTAAPEPTTQPLYPGLPRWNHTYKMNESTIIMTTNYNGWLDAEAHKGWGVIDIDWSDGMVYWGNTSGPMDVDPYKFEQVQKLREVLPASTKLMIYRNTAYAYNWAAAVRTILDDKAYADWFIQFASGSTHWPRCDTGEPGADPARKKCSDAWHATGWGPSCPNGFGGDVSKCSNDHSYCRKNSDGVPVCDCGDSPCGFYLFNFSTSTVVNGQTFQDWFINDYMYHGVQQHADAGVVNGFYWDDGWNPVTGGFEYDPIPYELTDTGLGNNGSDSTKGANSRAKEVAAAYRENMIALNKHVIGQGMFAWNMLWTGTGPALSASDPFSSAATMAADLSPVVKQTNCAAQLRVMCKDYNAPPHTRAMAYGIMSAYSPPDPEESLRSLANFLLIRGKYGYIGVGWNGGQARGSPAEVYGGGPTKYAKFWEADYGEPLGLCEEEGNQSGVFTRKWTKGTVTMDCNTWVPTFELNA